MTVLGVTVDGRLIFEKHIDHSGRKFVQLQLRAGAPCHLSVSQSAVSSVDATKTADAGTYLDSLKTRLLQRSSVYTRGDVLFLLWQKIRLHTLEVICSYTVINV